MAAQLGVGRGDAEGEDEREREAGHGASLATAGRGMKSRAWNTCSVKLAVPEFYREPSFA